MPHSYCQKKEAAVVAEAFIELGATVCRPKSPDCHRCPLQTQCRGFAQGIETELPINSKRVVYEALYRDVAVIFAGNAILLRQGGTGQVMAGLYEFPYFESHQGGCNAPELRERLADAFGIEPQFFCELSPIKHSFTRFRVQLYPKIFRIDEERPVTGYNWYPLSIKETVPFSAGHKKVVESCAKIYVS